MNTRISTQMFRSVADEERFFRRFDRLICEFGTENIVVALPAYWAADFVDYDGEVRIEFSTANEIRVFAQFGSIAIEESTPLFERSSRHRCRRHRVAA